MNKKKWKLYLDDLRTPVDNTFIVARNIREAQALIHKYGMPIFISFDHDLGMDEKTRKELPSGYDFAKWLINEALDGRLFFPNDFQYKVHSQNPVGKKNIEMLLVGYFSSGEYVYSV